VGAVALAVTVGAVALPFSSNPTATAAGPPADVTLTKAGPTTAVDSPSALAVKAMNGRNVMVLVNLRRADLCSDERLAYERSVHPRPDRTGASYPTVLPDGDVPVTATVRDLGREQVVAVEADPVPVEIWAMETSPDGFACSATDGPGAGLIASTTMEWLTVVAGTEDRLVTSSTRPTSVADPLGNRHALSARLMVDIADDGVRIRPLIALKPTLTDDGTPGSPSL
jgi:hypothetical protein